MKIRLLLEKFRDPNFQNQLWTIISACVFSVFPSLLALIATRQVGLALAGMLVHAVALSELPNVFTMFGVRVFQNVDVKQDYNFNIYLGLRTLCAFFVSIIFFVILVVSQFEPFQLAIILLVYFIYLTNAYADVFMGDLQQKGKMRVAGKMQASAFSAALILAAGILFITHSLAIALAAAGVAVFFMYVTWIWFYRHHFGAIRVKFDFASMKKLSISVLPIFVSGFLTVYALNAQKYYLNTYFNDEMVAVYAILILPISLLNLVCMSFFGGAIITKNATILANGQQMRFKKRVNLQLLLVVCLFIPFVLCVYFLGIPLLSWLYSNDLSPYRTQLLIVSVGGLAGAPLFVLNPVFIILRCQKIFFYIRITAILIVAPLMWWIVSRYGISGAAFFNFLFYLPQTIAFYIVYRYQFNRIVKKQAR